MKYMMLTCALLLAVSAFCATSLANQQLNDLYRANNIAYFNGELPVNVEVVLRVLPDEMGETRPYGDRLRIYIDPVMNAAPRAAGMTLLHEMVHVKLYGKDFDHGPSFQAEMHRLAIAGAFDKLW